MAESGDFSFVRPASEMIAALPEIELDAPQASFVRNGRRIVFPKALTETGNRCTGPLITACLLLLYTRRQLTAKSLCVLSEDSADAQANPEVLP